jgi:DNA-binding Lrp family transcriptional regulator
MLEGGRLQGTRLRDLPTPQPAPLVPARGIQGGTVSVSAYVLIQTEVGKAASVADSVSKIDGVMTAEDVTGPYDVIVRVESETMDGVAKTVVSRIQMVDGITRTLTCPVVHL